MTRMRRQDPSMSPLLAQPPPATVDTNVLRWPIAGALLRWRRLRTAAQIVLLLVAAIVVVHGLFGPKLAPRNLATVLVWIHYRGLLIGALLAVGNVFCGACPMILVRDLGRRLHRPSRHWPRWLRGKWLALGLFAAVLFAYELFDLWALPAATAWLVHRLFRRRAARRHALHRRRVLQARVPGRPVQLHRLDPLAARAAACATRRLPQLHDSGLHQGPS